MNQLIAMVETQQIILIMPLFLLQIPANAAVFYNFVMQVTAFEILPMDLLYESGFGWESTEIDRPNFDDEGFGSTLFLFNAGSMIIYVLLWPVLIVALLFAKGCVPCFSPQRIKRWRNQLFWQMILVSIYEGYFVLCICMLVNKYYDEYFTGVAQVTSFVFMVIFLFVLLTFPLLVAACLCFRFHKLHKDEVRESIGPLYTNLNLERGKIIILQPVTFLLRRLLLAYIVVFPIPLIFQYMLLQMSIIWQMIVIFEVSPYAESSY